VDGAKAVVQERTAALPLQVWHRYAVAMAYLSTVPGQELIGPEVQEIGHPENVVERKRYQAVRLAAAAALLALELGHGHLDHMNTWYAGLCKRL